MATLNWKGKNAYAVKTWTEDGKQFRQWIALGQYERKLDGKLAFENWLRWGSEKKGKLVLFEEIKEKYLEFSRVTKASRTYDGEKKHAKNLSDEFGNLALHDITSLRVETFKKKHTWKSTTWRNRLGLLKQILKYAESHGFRTEDPFKTVKIPSPKIHEFPTRAVPIENLDKLIEALPDRYKAFAAIMRYTALRPSEVSRLKPSDVNREALTLQILGKNKRYEILPFPEVLLKYLDTLPISLRLDTFDHVLQKTCKKLEIPHVSAYVFRHSVATYLINENPPGGQRTVQALLRHTTPYLTARYARATDQGLRAAADILGGRK